jgi:S-DNA-T family DNA segregation ATPase FtsK/SpoIIIE
MTRTTQRPRRSGGNKRRSSAKQSSAKGRGSAKTGSSATKSSAKTQSSAKTSSPAKKARGRNAGATQQRAGRLAGAMADAVADYLRDVWGIALLAVAVIAGLALYGAGGVGLVGTYLRMLFRGLLGVVGLGAPVALALAGVALLARPRPGNPRIGVGLVATLLAALGLWHLAAGAPAVSASAGELHSAGGLLGAALVAPLGAVLGGWGALVVLSALAAAGLVITTGVPPRRLGRRLGQGSGALVAAPSRLARVWTGRDRALGLRRRRVARGDPHHGATAADGGGCSPADHAQIKVLGEREETATVPAASAPSPTDRGAEGSHGADDGGTDTRASPPLLTAPETVRASGAGAATPLRPPDEADEPGSGYRLPPMSLLSGGQPGDGNTIAMQQATAALEHTMAQFGVDAHVARVSRGPTVTRFEIELGTGVKVAAVTKLSDDISYALATPEIRIVAPIPGKSAIGIEVPNRDRDLITLGDVLRSSEATEETHPLAAGIGVDIAGNPVMINLSTMPHLLIAGATGSGKSVTMNSIVTSIITRASPARVQMILIDPKRVELNHYEGSPHLLTPVITEPKRATEALWWTIKEMEDRYERLARAGFRNIDAYNTAVADGRLGPEQDSTAPSSDENPSADEASGEAEGQGEQALPYTLVIIDELADLMMVQPRDVESAIVRIAQMARAVGIHLIVATQRPSVDVVTGLIKANIPARLALAMATQADSRTILDQGGAEKLVGHGDMLMVPANATRPHRVQGCYVDEAEIESVVAHCAEQRRPSYDHGVVKSGEEAKQADLIGDEASDADLTEAAIDLVVRSGLGSTSMLQRKLKVGFARAGRLMDELEELGVVGPSEGPKAREVLMTVDELDQRKAGRS